MLAIELTKIPWNCELKIFQMMGEYSCYFFVVKREKRTKNSLKVYPFLFIFSLRALFAPKWIALFCQVPRKEIAKWSFVSIPPGAFVDRVDSLATSSAQWSTMAWWMWKRMRAWWLCSLIILTGCILCESGKCTRDFDCIDGICNGGFFCLCNENWWDDLCQFCRERLAFFAVVNHPFRSWVKSRNCLKNNRSKLVTFLSPWVPIDGKVVTKRNDGILFIYCQCLQISMNCCWSLHEMCWNFCACRDPFKDFFEIILWI